MNSPSSAEPATLTDSEIETPKSDALRAAEELRAAAGEKARQLRQAAQHRINALREAQEQSADVGENLGDLRDLMDLKEFGNSGGNRFRDPLRQAAAQQEPIISFGQPAAASEPAIEFDDVLPNLPGTPESITIEPIVPSQIVPDTMIQTSPVSNVTKVAKLAETPAPAAAPASEAPAFEARATAFEPAPVAAPAFEAAPAPEAPAFEPAPAPVAEPALEPAPAPMAAPAPEPHAATPVAAAAMPFPESAAPTAAAPPAAATPKTTPAPAEQSTAPSADSIEQIAARAVQQLSEVTGTSWEETREKLAELQKQAEEFIREKPTQAVLIAVGAGFVLHSLLRR